MTAPRIILRCLLALGLGLSTLPAAGELVVLDRGDFFKVRSYELMGEQVRLTLPSGGRVTLPLARVEHIVDDEVPLEREAPLPLPAAPPLPALAFDPAQPTPETPFGGEIYRAARRQGLNPALVAAVVRAESAFNPRAVSPKGARGLMQLMPATARRFGVNEREIFDPGRNVEAGTTYLKWLLERFEGDLPRALAGYNAGEGTVDRYGGVPPYRETRNYIRRIYAVLGLTVPAAVLGP